MIALILSILQLLILVGMVYVFDIYVYTGGAYKKAHVNNFLKILTFVAGCIPIVGVFVMIPYVAELGDAKVDDSWKENKLLYWLFK